MKSVALLDLDSKIPNFALMKLSAWHKSQGDDVNLIMPSMAFNGWDFIYASKVFTFTTTPLLPEKTIFGGTGSADISKKLPPEIDNLCPDYSLYNMDYSLGFFTRGCIRRCPWCIVPKKEGDIQPYAAVNDFILHKKAVLMDNNVLAHPHGIYQIERVAELGIKIDFNQGLDARLIDATTARLLSRVRWLKPIRLACDTQASKRHIERAVGLLRAANATPKRYFVYCLVTDDIDDARDRIAFLDSFNLSIFAQPYRDREGREASRTARELASWCNLPAMRKTITFEQYYNYRNKDFLEVL